MDSTKHSVILVLILCCPLAHKYVFTETSPIVLEAQLANDNFLTPDTGHCSDDVASSHGDNEGSFCSRTKKENQNDLWDDIVHNIKSAQHENNDSLPCTEKKLEDRTSCQCYTNLIKEDLKPFKMGITKDVIDKFRSRGTLYQILNGKLYREKSCKFPVRCSGIEHFLKKVAKDLPNMEFIVNVSDWPFCLATMNKPCPIFSFSKNKEYTDITYPAWTFWEGGPAISLYPRGVGRWDLMRKSLISSAKRISWKDKKSVGFFRGSRTSNERDALILLSRQNPHIIDAQYTKNQAWKSDADTLNFPATKEVSFEKHCDYKYLFNYRGVAASFRFKHLFLCHSLVFHVGDEWIEFFYPALKPWIHYIPVPQNSDQKTLKSFLEFFIVNDEVAFKIAESGYNFIKSNLKFHHVSCYWKQLLSQYGKLLNYRVTPRDDVIPLK